MAGSVSLKIGDGTARFRRVTIYSSALHIIMLFSVLTTNLFAFYAFTSHQPSSSSSHHRNISLISEHVSLILHEIEISERRLHQIQRDLSGFDTIDPSKPSLPSELKLFLARHPLPLGRDSKSGITSMTSSIGHLCARSTDALSSFMFYDPHSICPIDSYSSARKLISKACEPLPRRRCRTLSSSLPLQLNPFPLSIWNSTGFSGRGGYNGFDYNLFVKIRDKLDFKIDEVLALAKGVVRTGLDIAGGGGNFAARMAEKNVTVVTTTLDCGDVAAARGLFSLMISPAHRFPFYDSVFDLVHTMRGLDEGAAGSAQLIEGTDALEFLLFDIDRVLRTGGLFWIDNYRCGDEERKRVMARLIERFGFKKLKWVVGERPDAAGKLQVYLSAVLQKPPRV